MHFFLLVVFETVSLLKYSLWLCFLRSFPAQSVDAHSFRFVSFKLYLDCKNRWQFFFYCAHHKVKVCFDDIIYRERKLARKTIRCASRLCNVNYRPVRFFSVISSSRRNTTLMRISGTLRGEFCCVYINLNFTLPPLLTMISKKEKYGTESTTC